MQYPFCECSDTTGQCPNSHALGSAWNVGYYESIATFGGAYKFINNARHSNLFANWAARQPSDEIDSIRYDNDVAFRKLLTTTLA